jgi:hypothetical protein
MQIRVGSIPSCALKPYKLSHDPLEKILTLNQMKTRIRSVVAFSMVSVAVSVQAAVTEADGLGTSWLGTPSYATYPNPDPMNNPNGAFSAEGNYGTGGSGSMGGLAQGFSLTQGGTLSSIQLTVSGAPAALNLFLYDVGPVSGYSQGGSATFNPATAVNLLSAGLSASYQGGAGGAANVMQLTFSGLDAVSLAANEYYAFAIEPASGGTMYWLRGGNTPNPYGQLYRLNQFSGAPGQYGAINGGVREAGFAVTVVPEPASMALLGLGAAALVVIRRKH